MEIAADRKTNACVSKRRTERGRERKRFRCFQADSSNPPVWDMFFLGSATKKSTHELFATYAFVNFEVADLRKSMLRAGGFEPFRGFCFQGKASGRARANERKREDQTGEDKGKR